MNNWLLSGDTNLKIILLVLLGLLLVQIIVFVIYTFSKLTKRVKFHNAVKIRRQAPDSQTQTLKVFITDPVLKRNEEIKVEDDPTVVKVQRLLKRKHYNVHTEADLKQEFLNLLKKNIKILKAKALKCDLIALNLNDITNIDRKTVGFFNTYNIFSIKDLTDAKIKKIQTLINKLPSTGDKNNFKIKEEKFLHFIENINKYLNQQINAKGKKKIKKK